MILLNNVWSAEISFDAGFPETVIGRNKIIDYNRGIGGIEAANTFFRK